MDKKPFLLTVTLTQVHGPLGPHPDFKGKSGAGEFPDVLMELDYNVSLLLDSLKEFGLDENTIVILSGENGIGEQFGWGSNGPFRGEVGTS